MAIVTMDAGVAMGGRRWKLLRLDLGEGGPSLAESIDVAGLGLPGDASVVGVVVHSNQWDQVPAGGVVEEVAVVWSTAREADLAHRLQEAELRGSRVVLFLGSVLVSLATLCAMAMILSGPR